MSALVLCWLFCSCSRYIDAHGADVVDADGDGTDAVVAVVVDGTDAVVAAADGTDTVVVHEEDDTIVNFTAEFN